MQRKQRALLERLRGDGQGVVWGEDDHERANEVLDRCFFGDGEEAARTLVPGAHLAVVGVEQHEAARCAARGHC